ncbi:MAG: LpqB family beta-propeller domain-containing protein [Rhodanobacteraceae bacterium]
MQVKQIPAVALSDDGQYLAWITADAGKTTLMLGSPTGRHVHAVAIPGGCAKSGLSWTPRWGELAVMTHRKDSAGSVHSEIWVIDMYALRSAHRRPRKLADIDGLAHGMQWMHNLKRIAFLYTPAPETGRTNAAQYVAAVPVAGGPLEILTSSYLNVREFRISHSGHRIALIAVPQMGPGAKGLPRLYVQDAKPIAKPTLMVNPATISGPLHDLSITQPRWSRPGGQQMIMRKAGQDGLNMTEMPVMAISMDSRIYFIGGSPHAEGAIAGDIYAVRASASHPKHYYWFRGAGMRVYWYQPWPGGIFAVTGRKAGGFQLAFYSFNGSRSLRPDHLYFTAPGWFGDGRSPLAISTSWGGRPYLAFAEATGTSGPEVHCGLSYNGLPQAITSINPDAGNAVSSSNPAWTPSTSTMLLTQPSLPVKKVQPAGKISAAG